MTDTLVDFIFVGTLVIVGAWLESINGKHGFLDEFLTPLPLGIAGMVVIIERGWI
jgi:hypothetical protein